MKRYLTDQVMRVLVFALISLVYQMARAQEKFSSQVRSKEPDPLKAHRC